MNLALRLTSRRLRAGPSFRKTQLEGNRLYLSKQACAVERIFRRGIDKEPPRQDPYCIRIERQSAKFRSPRCYLNSLVRVSIPPGELPQKSLWWRVRFSVVANRPMHSLTPRSFAKNGVFANFVKGWHDLQRRTCRAHGRAEVADKC